MPLKPMQQDVKLGSGCAPQTQIKTDWAHVSFDDRTSSPVIVEKKSTSIPTAAPESKNNQVPTKHEKVDGDKRSTKKNFLSNKSKSARRSIFGQYIKEEDDSEVNDDSTSFERYPTNILEFSPPPNRSHDLRKRFSLLNEFPLEKVKDLPPLPTPLLRYTNDGSIINGGVYPLVEPKSILRKGKYSSHTISQEESSSSISDEQDTNLSENAPNETCCYGTASHTNDGRHARNLSEFERIARDLNLEDTKKFFRQSESSASDRERTVKFDPRIVITEFLDDQERAWFNDDDLNRFKRETLMLAQHYMMLHPEVADEYNTPTIDPITGKVRKKALYAMPGLCSTDGLDAFGSSAEIERLLKNAVRKILIVDPNKSILELFRKSIQEMFPTANITLVQTGEEALRLYETELERQKNLWDGHNRGFDIVIVEEQLSRQRAKVSPMSKWVRHHSTRLTRMRSDSTAYSSTVLSKLSDEYGIPKHDSLSNLEILPAASLGSEKGCAMSGSQLMQRICQLEEKFDSVPQISDKRGSEALVSEDSSVFAPPQRRSLLIGVSVNVEKFSQKLKNSGADLVWSKPPPTMDNKLRNMLISALIAKRQKASFCVKIPDDNDSVQDQS